MSDYNTPTLTRWENGLVVVNLANRLLNTSTIGFTVGSRNDPDWLDGAAHLVEHLVIFRGREIPSREVNRLLRRHMSGSNGPGINVFTMHSHTAYGHQDLLRRRYLQRAFGTFAKVVRDGMYEMRRMQAGDDPIITPEIFALEKAAVHNETSENDDDLSMASWKAALKLLYTTNPARRFGDSDPAQLEHVKLGRLKLWAQGWYVPANMRVILLGPTRDEAMRMVREAELDQIPKWEPTAWSYDHRDDIPEFTDIRSAVLERPGAGMHHVQLAWPTATYRHHRQRLALEVLEAVLKDRIEEDLRNNNAVFRGGVYHPSVGYDRTDSNGYVGIWFATKGDLGHTQHLIERVHGVIDRLKNDFSHVLEEDVRDARENRADDFLEMYRFVPGSLTDRMLEAMANGDPELTRLVHYDRDVLAVTAKQVRNAARRWLHRDRHVQVILKPV